MQEVKRNEQAFIIQGGVFRKDLEKEFSIRDGCEDKKESY